MCLLFQSIPDRAIGGHQSTDTLCLAIYSSKSSKSLLNLIHIPTVPWTPKTTIWASKRHHHGHIYGFPRRSCRRWSSISQRRRYIHPTVQRWPSFLNRYPRVLAHRFKQPHSSVGLDHGEGFGCPQASGRLAAWVPQRRRCSHGEWKTRFQDPLRIFFEWFLWEWNIGEDVSISGRSWSFWRFHLRSCDWDEDPLEGR